MVNAARVAGTVGSPTRADPVSWTRFARELMYIAVPPDDRIATTTAAATAAAIGRRRKNSRTLVRELRRVFASAKIAERMFDQASAGGSIAFGSCDALDNTRSRPSASALQMLHVAT